MTKIFLVAIFLTSSIVVLGQRDFQVTQFLYDKSNVNPAFAGANFISTVLLIDNTVLGGGSQLAGGQVARASARLLDSGVGLGLSFESFNIGNDFSSKELGGIYSYHIRVGDERHVSLGLETTYRILSISTFASQFQPPINVDQVEVSFGGLYYDESVYIGFSGQNLIGERVEDPFGGDRPITSGKRLFRSQFGATFSVSPQIELQPNVQLAYTSGSPIGYDINMMCAWKRTFSVGLSYRYANFKESITRDNIDFIFQFNLNKKLRVGTAFTFPQAAASVQTGGGEFSAIWVWSADERPRKELPFF